MEFLVQGVCLGVLHADTLISTIDKAFVLIIFPQEFHCGSVLICGLCIYSLFMVGLLCSMYVCMYSLLFIVIVCA